MATERQQAHLEKARAAKMEKSKEKDNMNSDNIKLGTPISAVASIGKVPYSPPAVVNHNDERVWINALVAAMRNLEVKHQGVVASCVPIADAALAAYKAKFK